MRIELEL